MAVVAVVLLVVLAAADGLVLAQPGAAAEAAAS